MVKSKRREKWKSRKRREFDDKCRQIKIGGDVVIYTFKSCATVVVV